MTYLPLESKVVYTFKGWKNLKTFESLEWLAALCSHVLNRGEQMVWYHGRYSNVSRGKRIFALTHKGGSPYTPSHMKQFFIALSPHLERR